MEYLESTILWKLWGILVEMLKKWYIPVRSTRICIFKFGHCKLHFFVQNTTPESCIKVTILVCGWCQAIPSKSKCQIRFLPLYFPNIPQFIPAVYVNTAQHCGYWWHGALAPGHQYPQCWVRNHDQAKYSWRVYHNIFWANGKSHI